MLDYLANGLKYKEDAPYEILNPKVHPWKWNKDNEVVNLSSSLIHAMQQNPQLKVLIMAGSMDLATPPDGMDYSVRHFLALPQDDFKRISTVHYQSGHMFYLHPGDLQKSRKDLLAFLLGQHE
jgi:carboxypeptidase C (cathepsin A)